MPNANTMIEYEKYIGTDTLEHITRKATANTTWTIQAINGVTYAIKFDKNFVKKHLYTSTKKNDKVLAKANELFIADGSPKDKTLIDYSVLAQKELDEAKFIKQLTHRSTDEQTNCSICGHKREKHHFPPEQPLILPFTATVKCKHSFNTPFGYKCICTGFRGKYEEQRTNQLKPTVNPLAGATTKKNTVIWMNKIDRATFEAVVVNSIIAKEKALGITTWNSAGEHITWDFGATNKGCVVLIDIDKLSADWEQLQGVVIVVNQSVPFDPNAPVYSVVHMHDKL